MMDTHCSGPQSKKFWKNIKSLKNADVKLPIYSMGCALQNFEERVLQELQNAMRLDAQLQKGENK